MTTSSHDHRTDIQVRFADTDAAGHVNNASYALYAEVARLEFLRELGAPVTSLILARLAIDFRRQAAYGDAVHVNSWIERLGQSSIVLHHTIVAADRVAADIESVVVYFDYAAGRAREIPADLRARLAPHQRALSRRPPTHETPLPLAEDDRGATHRRQNDADQTRQP